uniref:ZP domain-containing protein n=1 Tax=Pygocentrus nattereri TaxID=42514 RepID=A0AAR2M311_PYGNA
MAEHDVTGGNQLQSAWNQRTDSFRNRLPSLLKAVGSCSEFTPVLGPLTSNMASLQPAIVLLLLLTLACGLRQGSVMIETLNSEQAIDPSEGTLDEGGAEQQDGSAEGQRYLVFCGENAMAVVLPPGSLSEMQVFDSSGMYPVFGLPEACDYSLTRENGRVVLHIHFAGCPVTVEEGSYTLRFLYRNSAGQLEIVTVSCSNSSHAPSSKTRSSRHPVLSYPAVKISPPQAVQLYFPYGEPVSVPQPDPLPLATLTASPLDLLFFPEFDPLFPAPGVPLPAFQWEQPSPTPTSMHVPAMPSSLGRRSKCKQRGDRLSSPRLDPLSSPEFGALFPTPADRLSSPRLDPLSSPEFGPLFPTPGDRLSSPRVDPLSSPEFGPLFPTPGDRLSSPQVDPLSSPEFGPLFPTPGDRLSSPRVDPLSSPEFGPLFPTPGDRLSSPRLGPLSSPEFGPLFPTPGDRLSSPRLGPLSSPVFGPLFPTTGDRLSSPREDPLSSPEFVPLFPTPADRLSSPQRKPLSPTPVEPLSSPEFGPLFPTPGDRHSSPRLDPLSSPVFGPLFPTPGDRLSSPRLDPLSSAEFGPLFPTPGDRLSSPQRKPLSPTPVEPLSSPEFGPLFPTPVDRLSSPRLDPLSSPEFGPLFPTPGDRLSSPRLDPLSSPEFGPLFPTPGDRLSSPRLDPLSSPEFGPLFPTPGDRLSSPQVDPLSSPEFVPLFPTPADRLSSPQRKPLSPTPVEPLSSPEFGPLFPTPGDRLSSPRFDPLSSPVFGPLFPTPGDRLSSPQLDPLSSPVFGPLFPTPGDRLSSPRLDPLSFPVFGPLFPTPGDRLSSPRLDPLSSPEFGPLFPTPADRLTSPRLGPLSSPVFGQLFPTPGDRLSSPQRKPLSPTPVEPLSSPEFGPLFPTPGDRLSSPRLDPQSSPEFGPLFPTPGDRLSSPRLGPLSSPLFGPLFPTPGDRLSSPQWKPLSPTPVEPLSSPEFGPLFPTPGDRLSSPQWKPLSPTPVEPLSSPEFGPLFPSPGDRLSSPRLDPLSSPEFGPLFPTPGDRLSTPQWMPLSPTPVEPLSSPEFDPLLPTPGVQPPTSQWEQLSPTPTSMQVTAMPSSLALHSNFKKGCSFPSGQRLPCGRPGTTAAECLRRGCCRDEATFACYYPMDVCLADRQFIFVVPSNVAGLPINPARLMVVGRSSCKPVIANRDFAVFKFGVTECGTHSYQIGETTVYLAEVQSPIRKRVLQYGIITRDIPVRLMVECRYSKGSLDLADSPVLADPLAPQASQSRLMKGWASAGYMVKSASLPALVRAKGLYGVQLRIAQDETFTKFCSEDHQPLKVLLGKPVYLELRINAPNPKATLVVHYCVAYPRSAKSALVLLYEGCPNPLDSDNISILYVAGQSQDPHVRRFEVKAFQFMDKSTNKYLNEEIYFMCSTKVCMLSQSLCKETCFDGKSSTTAARVELKLSIKSSTFKFNVCFDSFI